MNLAWFLGDEVEQQYECAQPIVIVRWHQGRTQVYGRLGHGPGRRPKKILEPLQLTQPS
jgi:hypothetical protein